MKIKLLRNTIVGGKPVNAGETVDVSDSDGRYLCERGKAVPVRGIQRETTMQKPPETADKNPKAGK